MDDTQQNQEKTDYFLVSAHELRTSLSAMKWLFKMLLDEDFGSLNETQSSMIKQASESNERMIKLVNDTITMMKLDEVSPTYQLSPISLTALIDESIKDFTSEALQKNIRLQYNSPVSSVIVKGDADKLRIVLHNLFENAIKYSDSDRDVLISLKIGSGQSIFQITNHGLPIPAQEQSKMFQKFFRASSTKDHYTGIGLGLYASKHIINRHHGQLSFESKEDGETTFSLTLDLA